MGPVRGARMTRVRVHWNLTRGGFVVRGLPVKTGDMEYTDAVCLRDARFVVSDKGREYCRAKGARWVHAWVEGERCDCGSVAGSSVSYNPFRDESFVETGTTTAVRSAGHVAFRTHGRGKTAKPETRVIR